MTILECGLFGVVGGDVRMGKEVTDVAEVVGVR